MPQAPQPPVEEPTRLDDAAETTPGTPTGLARTPTGQLLRQTLLKINTLVDLRQPRDTSAEKRYLTVKEAAAYLGVEPGLIYDACNLQGLRHAKLSDARKARIRIRKDWLDDWMEERSVVNRF